MDRVIVSKFGGSSVANAKQIETEEMKVKSPREPGHYFQDKCS
jgi:aspartokinase